MKFWTSSLTRIILFRRMRFVDNCTDFIIAVLSTAICFVYTGKACFTGK